MARQSVYHKGSSGDVDFNMTPMIDCTFQLIIFFILASQTANEAYAKNVQPARPDHSKAIPVKNFQAKNRIVVNVVSRGALMDAKRGEITDLDYAAANHYEIKRKKYDVGDMDPLIEQIKNQVDRAKAAGEVVEGDDDRQFFLEVRADKRIAWQDVAPVIRAGVLAGVRKMNITALTAQQQ